MLSEQNSDILPSYNAELTSENGETGLLISRFIKLVPEVTLITEL